MKLKDIFLCWDFLSAVIISIICTWIVPSYLPGNFVKDIYSVGISVLSIVFSVFFAALAIIISSSDDDFVNFLDSEGHYQGIIDTFKYSIFMIFIALVYSIGNYTYITLAISQNTSAGQMYGWFVSYVFIFIYSMFCVFNATIDAIKYSTYRVKYLKTKKKK